MIKSEQINELAEALSKAQGEFGPVKKENVNPFFKSRYADLATILDAVCPTLAKHGLSLSQLPCYIEGQVRVQTILMHRSGQYIETELAMPIAKIDAQGIGSAITYGRRYALQSILGVAAEEDDDGNAAVSGRFENAHKDIIAKGEKQKPVEMPKDPPQDPKLITVDQRKRMFAIADKNGWKDVDVRNLLGKHGFEHSDEITKAAYDEICDEIGHTDFTP